MSPYNERIGFVKGLVMTAQGPQHAHIHIDLSQLSAAERHVIERIIHRKHVTRDVNKEYDSTLTLGQRVADRVAAFGGSWNFILLFSGFLLVWIALNSVLLIWGRSFDPYPFILLNLLLSMVAAIQAPFIMMSQNRQAYKDRLDAEHDYEVNLKAEVEILSLHQKIDELRERQWVELLVIQQRQIEMLQRMLEQRQATVQHSDEAG